MTHRMGEFNYGLFRRKLFRFCYIDVLSSALPFPFFYWHSALQRL
jgi:hypothetical protein